jgi:hypothetical protein
MQQSRQFAVAAVHPATPPTIICLLIGQQASAKNPPKMAKINKGLS